MAGGDGHDDTVEQLGGEVDKFVSPAVQKLLMEKVRNLDSA